MGPSSPSDAILERIRNLLAKAESTTFEAEAIAFTAKAQELMTRHAIEAAIVFGRTERRDAPTTTRVSIVPPYASVKSYLLQTVAEASRCRAVFHKSFETSTVIGFPADLRAAEMLFTSLLVQAQSSLIEAARHAPAGTRVRSKAFRRSFLMSFTLRIGERLRKVNEAVFAEAQSNGEASFLPVLRSQSEAIDAYVTKEFGPTVVKRVSGGRDAAGWAGGRAAADRARFTHGEIAS